MLVRTIASGMEKIVFETNTGEALILFLDIASKVKAFNREVFFSSELDHENIVKIRDINEELFYFIQDLAECDLVDFTNNEETRPKDIDQREALFVSLLKDIACALCYLKQKRIVHRDIKLENILIYKDECNSYIAKITDFSFAISLPEGQDCFKQYKFSGTLSYFAPENMSLYLETMKSGQAYYFCKFSDEVYSFAVLAYMLFNRTVPSDLFKRDFDAEIKDNKLSPDKSFVVFFVESLMEGKRPPFLYEFANVEIKELIESCWVSIGDRPEIDVVFDKLDEILL